MSEQQSDGIREDKWPRAARMGQSDGRTGDDWTATACPTTYLTKRQFDQMILGLRPILLSLIRS